jgi:hypothetical protein
VGESATLSVRIAGRGNIKSISEIPLPKLDGFRVFAPKARDSVRVEQSRVGGAKIFDLVLVPEAIGRHVLEGFSLAYFDPAKGAYVRTSAPPVEINVLEGDESAMRSLAAGGERRALRQDIRHIKRGGRIRDDLKLAPPGAGGVVFRLMPIVVGLAGVGVVVRRRHMTTTGKARMRKAFRVFARDLVAAEEALGSGDCAVAATIVARAIRGYVAARAGLGEAAVDAASISSIAGISEEVRAAINDLVTSLDRVRFAPVTSSATEMRGFIARAKGVMKRVDDEWRE